MTELVSYPTDPGIRMLREANAVFGNYTAERPGVPEVTAGTQHRLRWWAAMLAEMAQGMKEEAAQLRAQGLETDALLIIRCQLSVEETGEWAEALATGDLVKAAKELSDIAYVTDGHYLTLGLGDLKPALDEALQRSQMSKLDPATGEPIINAAGRWVKGPDYRPAEMDFELILAEAK